MGGEILEVLSYTLSLHLGLGSGRLILNQITGSYLSFPPIET